MLCSCPDVLANILLCHILTESPNYRTINPILLLELLFEWRSIIEVEWQSVLEATE